MHLPRGYEEQLLLIFLIALSTIFFIESFKFSRQGTYLFPRMMTVSVIILSVLILLSNFTQKNGQLKKESELDKKSNRDEREAFTALLFFIVFIGLIYLIGFMISSVLYLAATLYYYNYGSTRKKALITGIVTTIVYGIHIILDINVLQGAVFDLLL